MKPEYVFENAEWRYYDDRRKLKAVVWDSCAGSFCIQMMLPTKTPAHVVVRPTQEAAHAFVVAELVIQALEA